MRRYLEEKEHPENGDVLSDDVPEKCVSVLTMLAGVLSKNDPCGVLQQYSQGLVRSIANPTAEIGIARTHQVVVASAQVDALRGITCDPVTKEGTMGSILDDDLKVHRHPGAWEKAKDFGIIGDYYTCRILLLFAADGIQAAEQICATFQGYTYEVRDS